MLDSTLAFPVHLMLTHHGLIFLFLKVVLTLKISMNALNNNLKKSLRQRSDKDYIKLSVNAKTLKSGIVIISRITIRLTLGLII